MVSKKFKKSLKKVASVFLASLMAFTSVSVTGIQNVSAATLYNEATKNSLDSTGISVDLSSAGVNKDGVIYTRKLDSSYAWCMDVNLSSPKGTYARTKTVTDSIYNRIYNYCLNDELLNNYLGTTPGKWSDNNYAAMQALLWAHEEGCTDAQAGKILGIVISKVWSGILAAPESLLEQWADSAYNYSDDSGTLYIYEYGKSNTQRLLTTAKGSTPTYDKDEVKSTKEYSLTDKVQVQVNKTDVDTGKSLQGVKFDVYRDGVKAGTITTNESGVATYTFSTEYTKSASSTKEYVLGYDDLSLVNQQKIGDVEYTSKSEAKAAADKEATAKAKELAEKELDVKHTYKVVEVETKEGYYLNPNSTTYSKSYASGDGSGEVTFTVTNNRQLGSVTITKLDSETSNKVDGAVYGLYARDNITHPDGKTGVLYKKNQLVAKFSATDTSGNATLSNLYLGQYYVKEITAPSGYVKSTETYNVDLTYAGQNVAVTDDSATVKDTVQRAIVEFEKLDKELSNGKDATIFDSDTDGAQGDATREGAVYGLYAKEDIVHPDGSGVVTYNQTDDSIHEIKLTKGTNLEVKNVKATAGTLLATAKTDADGKIRFEHLYNGKYYIKEITPSEGYLLDTTVYNVNLSYSNQNKAEISKTDVKVYETVKKQAFDVVKVGHTSGTSQTAKPLEGVEFTVKLESDVARLGWDNAPTYDVITTDAEGKGSSIELPYGYYRVKETKPAADYDTANDFFVTVEEDSRTHQSFINNIVIDEEYQALLKIVKLDQETQKIVNVPNAEFKLKALTDVSVDGKNFKAGEYIGYWNWNILDGFYTDTWKTNEKGYVMLNEKLGAGEYQLEEIHAPEGYVLDTEPVKFKVSNSDMHPVSQNGKTQVIVVEKSDEAVKGQINVEKRGEVLVGYEDGQFVYKERALAGAKYKVIAKEDIMDPSNDGTVLYKKGTVVETLTTGTDGKASSSKLPLGTYEVVEVEAPDGMVLNSEKQTVELKYKDENTAVVEKDVKFVNERQKVKLDLNKLDLDENVALEGAEFTIYANKDIKNADGKVIVAKGEAVSVAVSDKDGNIEFDIDLPVDLESSTAPVDPDAIDGGFTVNTDENGNIVIGDKNAMFSMKETKRPTGYATLNATMYLDTTYQGQDVKDFTIAYDLYNEMTRVAITKSDISTGGDVVGAQLSIYPADENNEPILGESFDTWVTEADDSETKEDESIHLVKGLEPGKYVLREVLGQAAESGYVTAQDILFTVEDTGDIQTVDMKDDYTKVEFSKTDIVTGEFVVGTELKVIPLDENGEPKLGETFDTWVTEDGVHMIEYLPVGDYILREKLQGQAWEYGYVTADDVKFTVKDTGEIQKVEMKDDYTKLQVTKTDIVTGEPVPGAQLSIIPVKDDGTLDLGATWDTWITQADDKETADVDESVYYTERIPVGKYVLREVLGQAAELGYVTAQDILFEVKDTGEIQVVDMDDDFTKVEISKVDVDGNAVAGATMTIVPVDENGEPLMGESFDTWVTEADDPETKDVDESIHRIERMPIGKYMIIELSAPEGYVKAQPIAVEVKDTADVQEFTMTDKVVSFTKTDITGEKEVPGAEIEVRDEDGNIVDKWTSGEEPHKISGLEEGKEYTLVEILAPEGYVTAEEIKFTVTEEKVNQEVTMKDKQVDVSKVDVDGKYVEGAKLQIVSAKTKQIVDQWVTGKKAHYASNLIEGQTYILQEIETPEGYVKASDVEFTVTTEKVDQSVAMVDKVVTFSKTDITGEKEIPGAEIVAKDEDGNVVDTWISEDKPHNITGLEEGKKYYLTETLAPDGYVVSSETIEFEVTTEKINQHYEIKDKQVSVSKVDVDGKYVEGAKLQIISAKTKQIVDQWVTGKEAHYASNLIEGQTYILQEVDTPKGYVKASDVEFTVTAEKADQSIEMIDKRVSISKVDITNKEELPGAKLTITDKETGEVVDKWTSSKEAHYASNLIEGKTYILTEVTAPNGYEVAESIEFTVSFDKATQHIVMEDTPKHIETGDDTNLGLFGLIAVLSGISLTAALKVRKKENEE